MQRLGQVIVVLDGPRQQFPQPVGVRVAGLLPTDGSVRPVGLPALGLTVPLAFLSCILIERPALARKAPAPAESPQEAPFP